LDVENYLAQRTITNQSVLEAASMAAEACAPIDDIRSSARYRKHMVKNMTIRALHEVLEKLGKPAL
jgi:carbon-monoxide dehydrogenase medium subunit